MTENALVQIEQKQVVFYDDELTAVRNNDGHIYVSLRNLCDAMGVDAQAQTRRIRRQTILERGLQRVAILTTHRGHQKSYVLRVDLVPLFLTGISAKSVTNQRDQNLKGFRKRRRKYCGRHFKRGD